MKNARLGEHCNVGQNVVVSSDCLIGNRVKIQNNVSVYTGVEIEEDVFLGPSMVFTNVINPRAFIERKSEYRKTLVKKGASVGANATIVCGVTLGAYCLVGAGAVVTKDVLDFSVVLGSPARHSGWVCWCGERLSKLVSVMPGAETQCVACNRRYMLDGKTLRALA